MLPSWSSITRIKSGRCAPPEWGSWLRRRRKWWREGGGDLNEKQDSTKRAHLWGVGVGEMDASGQIDFEIGRSIDAIEGGMAAGSCVQTQDTERPEEPPRPCHYLEHTFIDYLPSASSPPSSPCGPFSSDPSAGGLMAGTALVCAAVPVALWLAAASGMAGIAESASVISRAIRADPRSPAAVGLSWWWWW
jgi:hypothetical protein